MCTIGVVFPHKANWPGIKVDDVDSRSSRLLEQENISWSICNMRGLRNTTRGFCN